VVVNSATASTRTFVGAASFATAGYKPGDKVTITHKVGGTLCDAIASSVSSATFTVDSVANTGLIVQEALVANEGNAADCVIARPALSALSEEERYSEVSIDNFNYYEVLVASNSHSVEVSLTLHSGSVSLYHSTSKLPSRDTVIGHDAKYPTASVAWTTGAAPKLTVPIAFTQINKNLLKVRTVDPVDTVDTIECH
jgi:hypothetical protein